MGEHKSYAELLHASDEATKQVVVGGLYRHFRNKQLYRVDDVTTFEEDEDVLVSYRPVDEPRLHLSRRLSRWNEPVEQDGVLVMRYALVQTAADEFGGDEADGQANTRVDVGADIVEA